MKTIRVTPLSKGRPARPPPVAAAVAAPRPSHGHAAHATSPGWLGAGLFRIMVLGAIVVGGIGVLLWLRDMGSAAGVNWLT